MENLDIICCECGYPTIEEFDEDGEFIGFREEPVPASEEAALAEGWVDSGLGLLCPNCAPEFLEQAQAEAASGAQTSSGIEALKSLETDMKESLEEE